MTNKWRTLILLTLAELLVMAVWFSASAVVPALTDEWQLDADGQAWLTMSVQIGFVVGAFGSAVLTLADRIPSSRFFSISALIAATMTAAIPLFTDALAPALILRFLTGVALAGVYPIGMKIMASWTQTDRGLGIGLLVGGLAIGSASPQLLRAFITVQPWEGILYLAAGAAFVGAAIGILFITDGPYVGKSPRFKWNHIGAVLRDREVMLANLGYLGHMWELYAMWTWFPAFAIASFAINGIDESWARLLAFGVIAAGGVGSLIAGLFADRLGRTTVTITSLGVSGLITVIIGFLFGGSPILLAIVALIWGFAIVADSAQFSACVSELTNKELIGTALTLQTSMGFLLTLVSIRLLPTIQNAVGWEWAFAFLGLGPLVGIWAMAALRKSDAAAHMANGNR